MTAQNTAHVVFSLFWFALPLGLSICQLLKTFQLKRGLAFQVEKNSDEPLKTHYINIHLRLQLTLAWFSNF